MISSTDKILIGVDGGATNCRVAIANSAGHRIAEAHGGPANIANNYDEAFGNILKTIDQALHLIGCNQNDYNRIHTVMGIAGNNLGDFNNRLSFDLPFAQSHVVNDGHITLVGALPDQLGVMAVLGTGSIFVGHDENGYRSVGGWGFLMGDEGSGAKMGYHLFERTIYAEDGVVDHSTLTREVIAEFHGSIGHLVESAKSMPPYEFGNYAPRVIDAAHKGDKNACAIIDEAVQWIEAQTDAVGFQKDRAFCVLGGLGPIFLPKMAQKYQDAYVKPKGNALDGAIHLAVEKWGGR